MEALYFLTALGILYFCIILPQKRRRNFRRNLRGERRILMNELIETMIGKRCEITGDISANCIGTILSAKENWIEVADDKGRKRLLNLSYVSSIREYPKKEK